MAQLRFFGGVMGAGKSTLSLQMEHNYLAAGRQGILLACHDRAGSGTVSSRLGMTRPAIEVDTGTDLLALVRDRVPQGGFVIADEAQFYTPEQVDQLAQAVDQLGIDVDCFGIVTDFASHLFPGSRRLLELADEFLRLQLEVLCWCGAQGRQNARIVEGRVVHTGEQVLVGDVTASTAPASYRVLCRRHWRLGQAGPTAPADGAGA